MVSEKKFTGACESSITKLCFISEADLPLKFIKQSVFNPLSASVTLI